jgi:hypothetical protein
MADADFTDEAMSALAAKMAPVALPSFPIIPRRGHASPADAARATATRMLRVVPAGFRDCCAPEVAAPRLAFAGLQVTAAAERLFAGKARRVTFYGAAGDGKTTAATMLVGLLSGHVARHYGAAAMDPAGRTLAFWDHALAWCSADDLAMEADYTDPKDGEPELARRMRTAPIAILDDLGNERGRLTGSNNVPPRTLQCRFDAGLVTITTTGLTTADLKARYGTGIARRLLDTKDPMTLLVGKVAK